MDWTGGARRRFAAGKNSATAQKQKQFFAKMRAAVQHTPSSQRAFQPEYLHSAEGQSISRPASKRQQRDQSTSHARHGSRSGRHAGHHSDAPRRGETVRSRRDISATSISSGSASSSAAPPRTHEHPTRSAQVQATVRHHDLPRTEEERLLMHRRSLLARKDWLGLNVARPLHMDFPSSHDKDMVGKRRKVKSSRRAKPAGHRLLTPLFEERLLQPKYFMSGALPLDEIQVKVGTEALASQTQPSRRSHTPANTSMRPPSTEFGPLSEESMLLGGDGDSFEAHGVAKRDTPQPYQLSNGIGAGSGEEGQFSQPFIPGTPGMRLLTESGGSTPMELYVNEDVRYLHDARQELLVEDEEDLASVAAPVSYAEISQQGLVTLEDDVNQSRNEAHAGRRLPPPREGGEESNGQSNAAKADRSWRSFFRVPEYSSSHASIAALKSSSQHLMTSDSSRQIILGQADHDDAEASVSTPKGAGTQKALLTQPLNASGKDSSDSQSPSGSLKQLLRLAEQPARTAPVEAQRDVEYDKTWEEFMVGSSDAESESERQAGGTILRTSDEILDEEPATLVPCSDMVSGLGTSVDATAGGTLFVTGSTSSARRSATELQSPMAANDFERRNATQMSLKAQRGSTLDEDSIEEIVTSPARDRRSTNIHTSGDKVLDPRRFKKSLQRPSAAKRRATGPNQFVRTGKKKASTNIRDIYDLVDSDGMSLA